MGQARRKKQLEAMGFDGQLQYRVDRIVREAEFLGDMAKWMDVQMPDGKIWIALMFKPSQWEHKDNKLTLKPIQKPNGEGK